MQAMEQVYLHISFCYTFALTRKLFTKIKYSYFSTENNLFHLKKNKNNILMKVDGKQKREKSDCFPWGQLLSFYYHMTNPKVRKVILFGNNVSMIFLAFFTSSRTEPSTWLISTCWALLSVLVTKTEGTRLGWSGSSLVTWLTFDGGTDHTLDTKAVSDYLFIWSQSQKQQKREKKKGNQEKLYWL